MDFIVKVLPVRRALSIKWHAGLITTVPKTAERYPSWALPRKTKKKKTNRKKQRLIAVYVAAAPATPAQPLIAWHQKPLKRRRKKADRSSQGAATFGTYSVVVPAHYPSFVLVKAKRRDGANRKLLEPIDIFGPLRASPAVFGALFKPTAKHRKGTKRTLLEPQDVFARIATTAAVYASLIKPLAKHRHGVNRHVLLLGIPPVYPVTPPSVSDPTFVATIGSKAKRRKNATNRRIKNLDSPIIQVVALIYPSIILNKATRRKASKHRVWLLTNPIYPAPTVPAVYASLILNKAEYRALTNRGLVILDIPPVYPANPGDPTPPDSRTTIVYGPDAVVVYGPYSVTFKL